jgi:hypothetical protein
MREYWEGELIILEGSFKAAYHDGLQTPIRKLSAEISTLTAKQDSLPRQLAAVEEQMSFLEKEVAQAGTGQARTMRCQNSKSKKRSL